LIFIDNKAGSLSLIFCKIILQGLKNINVTKNDALRVATIPNTQDFFAFLVNCLYEVKNNEEICTNIGAVQKVNFNFRKPLIYLKSLIHFSKMRNFHFLD